MLTISKARYAELIAKEVYFETVTKREETSYLDETEKALILAINAFHNRVVNEEINKNMERLGKENNDGKFI